MIFLINIYYIKWEIPDRLRKAHRICTVMFLAHENTDGACIEVDGIIKLVCIIRLDGIAAALVPDLIRILSRMKLLSIKAVNPSIRHFS
jgi:hypothetical protein